MPSEKRILATDDVLVTKSRLVIYGNQPKTYAMSQVNSVECLDIPPDNTTAMQLIIWGVVTACVGVGMVLILIGVILLCTAKTQYALAVRSSSGEQQFLVGADQDYIDDIVEAVTRAIVARG